MYLKSEQVKRVHIDFTSRCNAMCLRCSRNINGKYINPEMPLMDMSIDTFKNLFTSEFIRQVNYINFCGNYGDPVINNNLIPVLKYIHENDDNENNKSPTFIDINTNGGIKNEEFWKELALLLKNNFKNYRVVFSIDGLEDTNHLYRRNVKWEKLMSNVKTFINNGGKAVWQFIKFEHNSHQEDDVKKLAKNLGFSQVKVKKAHLPHSAIQKKSYNAINMNYKWQGEKTKKQSQMNTYVGDEDIKNEENKLDNLTKDYDNIENYLYNTKVACQSKEEELIMFQFTGEIWPCCWLTGRYRYNPEENFQSGKNELYNNVISVYGEGFNNINYYSLEQILNHEFFTDYLPNSWKENPDTNRLRQCGVQCGLHAFN